MAEHSHGKAAMTVRFCLEALFGNRNVTPVLAVRLNTLIFHSPSCREHPTDSVS